MCVYPIERVEACSNLLEAQVSNVRVVGVLSQPDSFAASGLLVGRMVANSTFLTHLMRHGDLKALHFFLGENSEQAAMESLASMAPKGLDIRWSNLIDLPETMETGELDVIHFSDVNNRMATTMHLRNRYARKVLPYHRPNPFVELSGQYADLSTLALWKSGAI